MLTDLVNQGKTWPNLEPPLSGIYSPERNSDIHVKAIKGAPHYLNLYLGTPSVTSLGLKFP